MADAEAEGVDLDGARAELGDDRVGEEAELLGPGRGRRADEQDAADALSLYKILEEQTVPLFANRGIRGDGPRRNYDAFDVAVNGG